MALGADPWLVLDGIEDLIDGESQSSERLYCPDGLEWIWREDRESLHIEDGLPLVLVAGMGRGLALIFSSSLPHLREWLIELLMASSN